MKKNNKVIQITVDYLNHPGKHANIIKGQQRVQTPIDANTVQLHSTVWGGWTVAKNTVLSETYLESCIKFFKLQCYIIKYSTDNQIWEELTQFSFRKVNKIYNYLQR